MRVHSLHHVSFEGLGSIEAHLELRGHSLSSTALYRDERLPSVDEFDWLIVMGGPMSVNDTDRHPWLEQELELIKAAIAADKLVLGICLGAQLIAKALGASVTPNEHREIGWFPVQREVDKNFSAIAALFPESCDVFHWHGETFTLPEGCTLLCSSEACRNQAFQYGERVLALQFHLETTFETARALITHCNDELDGSRWVQNVPQLLGDPSRFAAINKLMSKVLDTLEQHA